MGLLSILTHVLRLKPLLRYAYGFKMVSMWFELTYFVLTDIIMNNNTQTIIYWSEQMTHTHEEQKYENAMNINIQSLRDLQQNYLDEAAKLSAKSQKLFNENEQKADVLWDCAKEYNELADLIPDLIQRIEQRGRHNIEAGLEFSHNTFWNAANWDDSICNRLAELS